VGEYLKAFFIPQFANPASPLGYTARDLSEFIDLHNAAEVRQEVRSELISRSHITQQPRD
jgi:hypothetical protein